MNYTSVRAVKKIVVITVNKTAVYTCEETEGRIDSEYKYSELQWIATPARLTPARVCYAEMKVMTGLPYKEKHPTVCGV